MFNCYIWSLFNKETELFRSKLWIFNLCFYHISNLFNVQRSRLQTSQKHIISFMETTLYFVRFWLWLKTWLVDMYVLSTILIGISQTLFWILDSVNFSTLDLFKNIFLSSGENILGKKSFSESLICKFPHSCWFHIWVPQKNWEHC